LEIQYNRYVTEQKVFSQMLQYHSR